MLFKAAISSGKGRYSDSLDFLAPVVHIVIANGEVAWSFQASKTATAFGLAVTVYLLLHAVTGSVLVHAVMSSLLMRAATVYFAVREEKGRGLTLARRGCRHCERHSRVAISQAKVLTDLPTEAGVGLA